MIKGVVFFYFFQTQFYAFRETIYTEKYNIKTAFKGRYVTYVPIKSSMYLSLHSTVYIIVIIVNKWKHKLR